MSLEAQLATLNDNITRLISVLTAGGDLPVRNEAPQAPQARQAPQAPQAPQADKAANANANAGASAPKANPSTDAEEIPYDKVKDAVLSLVKAKGKDAAVAVLKTFGVANAKELPVDKYAAALSAVQQAEAA